MARKAWKEMTTTERDHAVKDAVSVIRQDYYSDVEAVADDIIEEAGKQFEDDVRGEELREWFLQYLHETIDSQGRVMYTQAAQLGLVVSDNDGAYLEEYGAEGAVQDGVLNWSALMFAAMDADVVEQLGYKDFDVNDPESFFEEEEEEE